jgi:acetyl-CoA/propionyl-CoA carboxylase biotin carboxyl carrier protein
MSLIHHHLTNGGRELALSVRKHPKSLDVAAGDEASASVEILQAEGAALVLRIGERVVRGAAVAERDRVLVSFGGQTWVFEKAKAAAPERESGGRAGAAKIEAPMTGTVVEVRCQAGEIVEAGTTLVVVTAMKMEHRLNAPARARVSEVLAVAGQLVDIGQVLVRLEPVEERA